MPENSPHSCAKHMLCKYHLPIEYNCANISPHHSCTPSCHTVTTCNTFAVSAMLLLLPLASLLQLLRPSTTITTERQQEETGGLGLRGQHATPTA
jgi:hypothetical protein